MPNWILWFIVFGTTLGSLSLIAALIMAFTGAGLFRYALR